MHARTHASFCTEQRRERWNVPSAAVHASCKLVHVQPCEQANRNVRAVCTFMQINHDLAQTHHTNNQVNRT
eukprot:14733808-Alexandrium_andersonii.AAC.1